MSNKQKQDALRRSIEKYKASVDPRDLPMYHLSLDQLGDVPALPELWPIYGVGDDEDIVQAFETARQVAMNVLYLKTGFSLSSASNGCESPIEQLLLAALYVAFVDASHNLEIRTIADRGPMQSVYLPLNMPEFPSKPWRTMITLQAPIGDYRVDFLVESNRHVIHDGDIITTRSPMIVECDGHDFHDRTKEQASRDRKRDRSLQTLGYRVFRFTGSDIWRDAFGCAREVLMALEAEWIKERDRIKALPSKPNS